MAGTLIFETDTKFSHYQVWDMVYNGRPARVLYSGTAQAAQSGVAHDDISELLFDYNQRFYEIVSAILPERVLLIGGGVYTLPSALLAALPTLQIDVVEIDSGLDYIARRFFNFSTHPRLRIINDDGRHYLEQSEQMYDIILIDVFTHDHIPKDFSTKPIASLVKRHLKPNGLVGMNIISAYLGRAAAVINNQRSMYEAAFSHVDIYPATRNLSLWLPQNLLLIAQPGRQHPVHTYVGYDPLESSPKDQDVS